MLEARGRLSAFEDPIDPTLDTALVVTAHPDEVRQVGRRDVIDVLCIADRG